MPHVLDGNLLRIRNDVIPETKVGDCMGVAWLRTKNGQIVEYFLFCPCFFLAFFFSPFFCFLTTALNMIGRFNS